MNKYKHLNATFDEILTHEIGHLISIFHYNSFVEVFEINPSRRHVVENLSKDKQQILQVLQQNHTNPGVLNHYRDALKEILVKLISGDVMLELAQSRFVANNIKSKIFNNHEVSNAYQFELMGVIALDELIEESVSILTTKKDEYFFWKWFLLKMSHYEKVLVYSSILHNQNSKLLGRFRRLHVTYRKLLLRIRGCR